MQVLRVDVAAVKVRHLALSHTGVCVCLRPCVRACVCYGGTWSGMDGCARGPCSLCSDHTYDETRMDGCARVRTTGFPFMAWTRTPLAARAGRPGLGEAGGEA